jgi:serine/threonine-protein kinase
VTDTDEELLADLLLRWEELRDRGQDTPAAELCQTCPHLVDELARRINALKVTSWMDMPIGSADGPAGPVPSTPAETRTLAARYRLDEMIAEGGFAQVWRGYDLELQRAVAVKVPKPSRLQSADAFMVEARRVARLKHPGIVPVFDVGREGEFCFIVSEFVEGGSLGDHLVNTPPSQQQAIRWLVEVADALEYAHLHGVVHRDIKPANILIDHHGRALLADFGIAQSANTAGKQALSLGTLRYMSPEQLEGKPVDSHADIFSLGVVLHEALTGKLPYSSAEPNVLRREIVSGITSVSAPDIPAELKRICQKALQHDPPQRHTSAAHFAADLRRYLASSSPSKWRLLILVALAFALAVGAAVIWWRVQQRPTVDRQRHSNDETVDQPAPPQKPALTVEEAVAQGKMLFDQKSFDRAADKFTEAIRLDPKSVEAYDKRGACKFNGGKVKASLADFDKAITLDPRNAEFYKHRASAYASLRQFEPAIADGERALKLMPADAAPYHDLLARLYSNRAAERSKAKKFAESADDVTQAIKYDPQAVYYHERGSCFFNMKEYEKAAADFTEAIRREPTKGAHYLHRGRCFQALGREEEAAADFEKAKSLGENK